MYSSVISLTIMLGILYTSLITIMSTSKASTSFVAICCLVQSCIYSCFGMPVNVLLVTLNVLLGISNCLIKNY